MIRRMLGVVVAATVITGGLVITAGVVAATRTISDTGVVQAGAVSTLDSGPAPLHIGDTGSTGPFAVTVTSVERSMRPLPPDPAPADTPGEFVTVTAAVENTSPTERTLLLDRQLLVVGKDTFYPVFADATVAQVRVPSVTEVPVVLVYETPADPAVTRVVFSSSVLSDDLDFDVSDRDIPLR